MSDQRTIQQNKSLYLYFDLLADALNDAGYEMKHVMEIKEVDVPWTKERVKEVLFKSIMEAMTGKRSTTELDTVEISKIYDVLDRHTSEKLGIHVEWPSLR